jgi:hypothetical protein
MSLLANFVLLGLVLRPAQAQFTQSSKQWAVIDFVNKSPLGGPALGGAASDAVSTLLLGTNRYDILPRETVERIYKELELTPPVTRDLDVLRIGQALSAETIIVGEISDARINTSALGKSADVVLVVRGIDVASGLPVLGAAVHGQSSERPGDVSDDVVLNEAISYAAQQAVNVLMTQQVDIATVLTTPTTRTVTLNKGAREGLKIGMQMVVTRGKEEVARIRINDLSPDVSTATVISQSKGVAPGDKARAIYNNLPVVTLQSGGGARVRAAKSGGSSSSLMSILVVGALAAVIGAGGSGSGAGDVRTEATSLADGITPGVKISWSPSIFSSGRGRVEWQIWRNDVIETPVRVVPGVESHAFDDPFARTDPWRNMGSLIGGTDCVDDPGQEPIDPPAPGIQPGTSYMYMVSLVYKLFAGDLPGGTGDTECFFQTGREQAKGQATPLDLVTLVAPENGATDIGDLVQFTWESTPGADQYAVEVSTQSNFANASRIAVVARVDSVEAGNISTDPLDISGVFSGTQRLYWRVGARNSVDVPGPVKDAKGERYVFSRPFQFDRPEGPPPPPLRRGATAKGGGTVKGGTGKGK